jgi:hypothetical protein
MRPLAAVERFFERFLERPTARLFRVRVQPVSIRRRIERAMEYGRISDGGQTRVPGRFVVRLNPAEVAALGDRLDGLQVELAEAAAAFARRHRYQLPERAHVEIRADPSVGSADIVVDPGDVWRDAAPAAGSLGGRGTGAPTDGDRWARTALVEVPRPVAPLAVLRQVSPDGTQRALAFDGGVLTIGRAGDNGLVVRDARVSRHHGRLQSRRGVLVYTDLGSANGSRVNGVPVDEVALGVGDRIEIGATVLVVERGPAA